MSSVGSKDKVVARDTNKGVWVETLRPFSSAEVIQATVLACRQAGMIVFGVIEGGKSKECNKNGKGK